MSTTDIDLTKNDIINAIADHLRARRSSEFNSFIVGIMNPILDVFTFNPNANYEITTDLENIIIHARRGQLGRPHRTICKIPLIDPDLLDKVNNATQ